MKQFYFLILFAFTSVCTFSQPLYIQANFGYGFSLAPRAINLEEVINNYAATNTYSYKVGNRQSLGKGLHFGATVGYFFDKHASFELGLDYTTGVNLTNTVINNYNYVGQPVSKDVITTIIHANMFRVMPGIKISTGEKKFKPYLKAGVAIGFVTKYNRTHNVSADNGTINTLEEKERTGPPSLGYYGGLGFSYSITKRIQVFAEGLMISQTWSASKENLTKKISNGKETDISLLNPINRETVFLDVVNVDGTTDVNKPQEVIKDFLPFSNVGINAGLAFTFSKREAKPKK